MVDLSNALSQLRLERSKAEQQLSIVVEAISVLEGPEMKQFALG
jgi:hypothetical protein